MNEIMLARHATFSVPLYFGHSDVDAIDTAVLAEKMKLSGESYNVKGIANYVRVKEVILNIDEAEHENTIYIVLITGVTV